MGFQPIWRVVLRGALTPDVEAQLRRAGLIHISSSGGGSIPLGGQLPEPTSHAFAVGAPTAEEALTLVRDALGDLPLLFVVDVEPPTPLDG